MPRFRPPINTNALIVEIYDEADTMTRRQAPYKIHTAASGKKRAGMLCFSGLWMTLTLRGRDVANVFIRIAFLGLSI